MGLFILFIGLIIFYIVDCVLNEKLNKSKREELRLLKSRLDVEDQIHELLLAQRNMLYSEIKKFNDNVGKFNNNVDKFNDHTDDGK